MVTGVGIIDDLMQFFDLIKQLYGIDMWTKIKAPIELEQITHLAGYNLPRTVVYVMNWLCFGTILAKGRVSRADRTWYKPWDQQPGPQRLYLAGDVAQLAATAITFWYISTMFVFPDISSVCQLGPLDGPALVTWWKDVVLPGLTFRGNRPPDMPQDSLKQLWGSTLDSYPVAQRFAVLQPDWPSLTAGGPRYAHAARVYHIRRAATLEKLGSI